jgi:hypothetical protein
VEVHAALNLPKVDDRSDPGQPLDAGVVEVALVGQDEGEVAEAAGGVGVVVAEVGLEDRQGVLTQGASLRVAGSALQVVGRAVQ